MKHIILLLVSTLCSLITLAQIPPLANDAAPEGMKRNALGIVKDIRLGWNLGNQLESLDDRGIKVKEIDMEMGWGNPRVTPEMIQAVKDAGFNAIRIPVRWYPHCDKDFTVNKAWMARVREVVDYAYNRGMYVMLNTHHDHWYDRWREDHLPVDEVYRRMRVLWTQIATEFRDYDERLIFAGVNEMITQRMDGTNEWGEPSVENVQILQHLYQEFIDAVRATGGNNSWRVLCVSSWAANPFFALKYFRRPYDVVEDRLMLEVHYYQPWPYAAQTNGDSDPELGNFYFWGRPYAGQPRSVDTQAEVKRLFSQLKREYIDKGLPIVLGEFGAVHHIPTAENGKFGIDFDLTEESRAYYLRYIVREAKDNGFCSFYWDNNYYGGDEENFAIFNRYDGMKVYHKPTLDAMMMGAHEGVFPF